MAHAQLPVIPAPLRRDHAPGPMVGAAGDRPPAPHAASSCTPPGPHSRASTTPTDPTFRRSTHRSSSVARRTPGSGPSRPGGRDGWSFSPALLILPFPGLFRVTCYYYRGAYYKAFWADPPACAVGEPRKRYRGEAAFPLIVQNIHRYFLYVALLLPGGADLRRVPGALVHRPGHRRDSRSASGSARWCSRRTSRCSAATRWGAIPCATWPADISIGCPARRCASGSTTAPAASTGPTCAGPGPASSRSRSPTCTSGCARWGSGPIGESSEPGVRSYRA